MGSADVGLERMSHLRGAFTRHGQTHLQCDQGERVVTMKTGRDDVICHACCVIKCTG